MLLGTFNKLGGANLQKEGRRYNEQERFFNLCFSNYYLPFTIIVIYNFNIKKKPPNSSNDLGGTTYMATLNNGVLNVPLIFYEVFFIHIHNNTKTTF